MVQKEVGTVQKSVWRQFSFYCLVFIVLITIAKKSVALSVTTFLLLTGVSYFLLGLMIGDLGWGFFSAHSKTLFLRTNWLLKLPFSAVNAVVEHRKGYSAPHPVAFAEMVMPSAQARHPVSDQGRDYQQDVHEQAVQQGQSSVTSAPATQRMPQRYIYGARADRGNHDNGNDNNHGRAERSLGSVETSLLAEANREMNPRQESTHQERHQDQGRYFSRASAPVRSAPTGSSHAERDYPDSDGQPSPLAMFDRLERPVLTPQGNGIEVAKVLAERQPAPRRMVMAPQDEMLLALKEAHGI
ncbi:hypothetical protein HYS47_03075 [Candidatus Woesearchaeota archaeon]|nr:hypothetical protein [Candidatus Woesearchaeota archaeon]